MGLLDGMTIRIRADISGLTTGLNGAAGQMRAFAGQMDHIGRSMKDVGKTLSLYLTLPLEEFGRHALEVSGDFQAAMFRVQALSQSSAESMRALEAEARQMGATTKFTATDAADALGIMAMMGYNASKMLAALPQVMRLAAASGLEMAQATSVVDNVMAGFRLHIDELAHANDVLVSTFTHTNTTLEDLGVAMRYVGPVAASARVPFEQVAAALGMLGNAGLQGSMGGTSLRGALSRLLSPSKQVRDAMDAAHVSVTRFANGGLDLVGIIRQLESHSNDAGLMMTLFGQRAGPAMAALAGMGSHALQTLVVTLEASEGTANRVADAYNQGLNGAIFSLKSAFESLQLSIGNAGVTSFVEGLARGLADLFRSLSHVNPQLLLAVSGFAALVAAIPPLLIIVGTVVQAFGAIFGVLAGPVGLIALLLSAVAAFALFSDVKAQIDGVAQAMHNTEAPMARITELNQQLATASRDTAAALRDQRQANLELLHAQAQQADARYHTALQASIRGGFMAALPGTATQNELQAAEANRTTTHAQYLAALRATNDADSAPLRQRLYDRAMEQNLRDRQARDYSWDAWARAHPDQAEALRRGNPGGAQHAISTSTVDDLDLTNAGGPGTVLPSTRRAQELQTLRAQAAAVGLTTQQLEHLKAVQDALNEATNAGEHLTREQAEQYVNEREALTNTINARERAEQQRQRALEAGYEQHRQAVEQISDNQHLAEAADQGAAAYRRMTIALELMHRNANLTMEDALQLADQIDQSNQQLARAQERMNRMGDLARSIGDAFGSAFEKAVTEGGKLSDMLRQLAKDILLLVLRATVIQPLANSISGLINGALGGGKSGGKGGGAKSGLTSFITSLFTGPHADGGFIPPGKWGTVGERGIEAVFGGRTGVTVLPNNALGGGGGAPSFVFAPVYHFDGATAQELATLRQQTANDRAAFDIRTRSIVADMRQRGRL